MTLSPELRSSISSMLQQAEESASVPTERPQEGRLTIQSLGVRACVTCAYFMKGVKAGEPNICNALHSPPNSLMIMDECPDYEEKDGCPSSAVVTIIDFQESPSFPASETIQIPIGFRPEIVVVKISPILFGDTVV